MFNRCQNLIATVLHTSQTLSKITEPPAKGVRINLHSSSSLIHRCQNYFSIYITLFRSFSSSLLMKTSCLRLKLVELNFLVSFNTDDQSKTDVTNTVNITTYNITFPSTLIIVDCLIFLQNKYIKKIFSLLSLIKCKTNQYHND